MTYGAPTAVQKPRIILVTATPPVNRPPRRARACGA